MTRAGLVVAFLAATLAGVYAQEPLARAHADLAEGRRLFDALDYERAVPALDRAIAALEGLVSQEDARVALVQAFEMRARARFGMGDTSGAGSDLRALLALDSGFEFPAGVSPRIVALLDDVRHTVVGALLVAVEPPDAVVELDGAPLATIGVPVALRAAEYTLTASRVGFRSIEQRVVVEAGETRPIELRLERVAATVLVMTSPPHVEIVVDGISRGRTQAGVLPARYADVPGQLGVAPEDVSAPMLLSDIGPGAHVVQFRRDCHVTEEQRVIVDDLADYRIEPVRLRPAVATVEIESRPAGAAVFVDGEARGTAPVHLADVCEGARLVELRGPQGRYARRLDVRPGESVRVSGTLKPAFALLPAGFGVSTTGLTDVRTAVERALAGAEQITVFVPAERQIDEAFKGQPVPQEWLAFDAGRRPVGAAATISATARRDLSAKLGRELGVQGVAAVTQPSPTSPDLVLALLAAGAGEPDVVVLNPEHPESVGRALARFDFTPPVTRPTIGAQLADVLDRAGPVVVQVEPGGGAAAAGLTPGELIESADGQAIAVAQALDRALEGRADGVAAVTLRIVGRDGGGRTVQVPVHSAARLISAADQTLLFNPLAVALRTRLDTAPTAERPFVQLNLAVALLRLGDFAAARELLESVTLPAAGPISKGTQQYLLGLALEGLGDAAGAQRAFQHAAATTALLTEEGPPVRPLAEARLRGAGSAQP